jgi:hypothetical protein
LKPTARMYLKGKEIVGISTYRFKTPMYLKILWKLQRAWGWVKSLEGKVFK